MGEQKELDAEEELYHLQESTNEDGTVDVEIIDWVKKRDDRGRGEYVHIDYRLPTLEEDYVEMNWPKNDTDEWKFVRMINHLGYSLASVNQIKGEEIKYDQDKGKIVVPEHTSKIKSFLSKINDQKVYWYRNGDMITLGLFSSVLLVSSILMLYLGTIHDNYFNQNIHEVIIVLMSMSSIFGFLFGGVGGIMSLSFLLNK